MRSVTWPADLSSLATRPITAADAETVIVAQASATIRATCSGVIRPKSATRLFKLCGGRP